MRAWDRSGFKTKRPPRPGAKRFAPERSTAPAGRPRRQSHLWFWEEIDPGARAARPPRWETPIETLRTRRLTDGAIVSEARLERVVGRWGTAVGGPARAHEISEALILAVIAVESAGNPGAVSPKGATGLMQLMPATGRRFGVRDARDPAQNLDGGTAYLDFLLDRFGGDIVLALAGYNAGENAVDRHDGVPPYAETRDYVVLVLDALAGLEKLCATPPASPRGACALRLRSPPA